MITCRSQARSLDKGIGDPPDFGVGNSSYHQQSTLQMEGDGVHMSKSTNKKTYASPYSQRKAGGR
jgi:hypothetical protein